MPRKRPRHRILRPLIALVLAGSLLSAARAPAQPPAPPAARAPAQLPAPPPAAPTTGWTEAVLQARTRPSAWAELERAFPIPCDCKRGTGYSILSCGFPPIQSENAILISLGRARLLKCLTEKDSQKGSIGVV